MYQFDELLGARFLIFLEFQKFGANEEAIGISYDARHLSSTKYAASVERCRSATSAANTTNSK